MLIYYKLYVLLLIENYVGINWGCKKVMIIGFNFINFI